MEDPWKPVVNTVTIRLDGKRNGGGKQKWAKEEEVRKMEKERGREGGGEKEWRSTFPCVPRRSRSTWFVRASMWANNAHFGSNRDALHFVHYSVHVSMWSGCREERGGGKGGYTLSPSLPARALPTTSRSQKTTHASTVHGEGFSSAPATVERPLECHSSKFATRQVASSRMALPASSSGDEVEGNPSSQTGRGLGDQIFAYPPREDGIGPPRTFLVFLPSTLLRFHAWSRFRGVTDSRRGNRE